LVRWLDLRCGRGRALIEAAWRFARRGKEGRLEILGVDLVGMFDPIPRRSRGSRCANRRSAPSSRAAAGI
jgi:hypothetical protein